MYGNGLRETYDIKQMIGKGSGGEVYLAFHKRLRKLVVLKRIKGHIDPERARIETDILKQVKHAYLPQVLDYIEIKGNVFTVMDYIQGISFKQILKERRKPDDALLTKWFIQLCEALEVLHGQKPPIIHGDIKPDNVMKTDDGNICLIDFNISSYYTGGETRLYGYTKGYAAPEQIHYRREAVGRDPSFNGASAYNSGAVQNRTGTSSDAASYASRHYAYLDERTDIYSLGATMFHMYTGVKPYPGIDAAAILDKECPKTKPALKSVICKTMEENPGRRYETVTALKNALLDLPRRDSRYKALKIKQGIALAGVGLFTAACIVTAFFGWRKMQDKTEKAQVEIAREYVSKQRYNDGIIEIEQKIIPELRGSENLAEAYYNLGECYYWEACSGEGVNSEGNDYYKQATAQYEEAIRLNEGEGKYHYAEAIALTKVTEQDNANLDKADSILQRAKKLGFREDQIEYVRGHIARERHEYDQAEKCFITCHDISDDAQLRIGSVYNRFKLYDDACKATDRKNMIKILRKAYKDPKLAESKYEMNVLISMGNLYSADSDSEKAIRAWKKALEVSPKREDIKRSLVKEYINVQDYSSAEKEAETIDHDYLKYAYIARIELSKQDQMPDESRDYERFDENYHTALKLFEDNHISDNEMQKLMGTLTDAHDTLVRNSSLGN